MSSQETFKEHDETDIPIDLLEEMIEDGEDSFHNPKMNCQETLKEHDETDIPVDLLQEIVEDGEDSFHNPKMSCQETLKEHDETDIPSDLLEEIIENGEDNMINPLQLESSVQDASLILPAEQLQTLDSIFSLGSQEFFLNKCGAKRLIVGLTSPGIPNLQITFKMHDLKNDYSIKFTSREWKKIVHYEIVILNNLMNNYEDIIYFDNQWGIETFMCSNRAVPCVKFSDMMGNDCSLALETFQRMMMQKNEIEQAYVKLKKNLKDVPRRIKLFTDTTFLLLFKSNNIDSRHTYNQQMLSLDKSCNFLNLSSSVAQAWKQLGEFKQNT